MSDRTIKRRRNVAGLAKGSSSDMSLAGPIRRKTPGGAPRPVPIQERETIPFVTYLRAGTISSDPNGSLAYQAQITRAFGEKLGWRHVGSYSDIAHTAGDRPGLRALLTKAQVNTRPFEAIVVEKGDRVSRDTRLYSQIKASLARKGVRLCALDEWVGGILAEITRLRASQRRGRR
jgi:Resolvase, N terminal domain